MTLNGWVSPEMLAVWAALGTLVGTLLLAAAALWASGQVMQQARALWRAVRGHREEIVAAIDEPSDPLIAQLGHVTPVPAAIWAAFLPVLVEALAAGLDRELREAAPADPAPDA